jgi:ketosteroid isomerase-like protein
MLTRALAISLALGLLAPAALAHGEQKHPPQDAAPAGYDTSSATLSLAPEAAAAVEVLERFSAALRRGDLEAVAAELDPAVLVLEGGGAERSREEYLGGHAGHDAEFLKAARIRLKRRSAQAVGDLAWIGSESEIHATRKGEPLNLSSTETVVLQRRAEGWKIVHIHWSSRRADSAH